MKLLCTFHEALHDILIVVSSQLPSGLQLRWRHRHRCRAASLLAILPALVFALSGGFTFLAAALLETAGPMRMASSSGCKSLSVQTCNQRQADTALADAAVQLLRRREHGGRSGVQLRSSL